MYNLDYIYLSLCILPAGNNINDS